jgi:hypothetical protein
VSVQVHRCTALPPFGYDHTKVEWSKWHLTKEREFPWAKSRRVSILVSTPDAGAAYHVDQLTLALFSGLTLPAHILRDLEIRFHLYIVKMKNA